MKRVLTVGVYDLLHKGHVELFRRAKSLGDYLIVAVQNDRDVIKYKPNANLINSTEDRQYMVNSIKYVDEVISYSSVDNIISQIEFDIFVTGPDQTHTAFQKAIKWCKCNQKQHVVLSRTKGISTTDLKELINSHK